MNGIAEKSKFASDVMWVCIADVLSVLTGIIILPALTKNYPSSVYGMWAQIVVTLALLTPITTLHLETALVRHLANEDNITRIRHGFATALWVVLIMSCVMITSSFLCERSLSVFFFKTEQYYLLTRLTFVWISASAFFSIAISYLRVRRLMGRLSLVRIAFALLKMLVIYILSNATVDMTTIIICLIAECLLFFAVLGVVLLGKESCRLPDFKLIGTYLSYSLPLIPMGVLLWVNNACDRYFITHFLDLSLAGIYSASYSFGGLINLFCAPIAYVLFPNVAKLWENNEKTKVRKYIRYSIKVYLSLAMPAAAGLTLLSSRILTVFATKEFAIGSLTMLFITTGSMLFGLYQILVYAMLLAKKTRRLPFIAAVSALVNTVINIVLIPQIGIMGAAISTIVSYFLLSLIILQYAKQIIGLSLDITFLVRLITSIAIMLIVLHFIPHETALDLSVSVVTGVIVFCLCIYAFRVFDRNDITALKQALGGETFSDRKKMSGE